MTRKEYRQLIKKYKQAAKEKYKKLTLERRKRLKLPISEQIELLKKDRKQRKAWKRRIRSIEDTAERRSQKKGYRKFRRLQHRKYKIAIIVAVVLFVGYWCGVWYYTATRPLTPAQQSARAQSEAVARKAMDEGMVLLRNENQTLPLKQKRVSVFGVGSVRPVYGGGGAGGIAAGSSDSLYTAFDQSGIQYSKPLYNLYSNYAATGKASTAEYKQLGKSLLDTLLPSISGFLQSTPKEMPASELSDDVMNQAAAASDTAIYVLPRTGTETIDLKVDELRLSDNERQTLQKLDKAFKHIVVIANTTNTMELGFVEEFSHIDSVLWVGAPGELGFRSVANALTGEVTPSGKLTDTYTYNLESNPAVVNTGNFQYRDKDGNAVRRYFENNQESIYVGYRYYEIFLSEEEYAKTVQYPFGYGLSYTTFNWSVQSTKADAHEITATIKVTNTGAYAGKDVVELYYTSPFTQGAIDKSTIALGGFAKTKQLQPGESDTVTVTFSTDSMASYDDQTARSWVLDKGDYLIKVGHDVHHIMHTFTYTQPSTKVIKTDNTTGATVTNQFDDVRGDITYLSRSNPTDTMPTKPSDKDYILPDSVVQADYRHIVKNQNIPTTGAKNNILLKDLKDLSYDDAKWQAFLDQLTDKELVSLAGNGGYWTIPIKRLGIPKTTMYDGPASIRSFLGAWSTVAYPVPVVYASTWNTPLVEEIGAAMGNEAKSFNVDAVYAPSLNMHRSPLGGRNFEYFSEDPLVAGKMGAAYTRGIQSTGRVAVMKHFVANDQETNRANYGLYVWTTEQSLREIYLKPFELAVKEGGAHGAMSAFNRVGTTWAGGSKALLTNVLRDEWGFKGFVITDAGVAGQGDHFDALQATEAGNDLMLAFLIDTPGDNTYEKQLKQYLKEDRAGTLVALRSAAHNICYYILQTDKLE